VPSQMYLQHPITMDLLCPHFLRLSQLHPHYQPNGPTMITSANAKVQSSSGLEQDQTLPKIKSKVAMKASFTSDPSPRVHLSSDGVYCATRCSCFMTALKVIELVHVHVFACVMQRWVNLYFCSIFAINFHCRRPIVLSPTLILTISQIGPSPKQGEFDHCLMVLCGTYFGVMACRDEREKDKWIREFNTAKYVSHENLVTCGFFNRHAMDVIQDPGERE
jgi:hypothetical protein